MLKYPGTFRCGGFYAEHKDGDSACDCSGGVVCDKCAVFRERITPRHWIAIGLVTVASAILSFEGKGVLSFNKGSLLVLCACICWGIENNCTRRISDKCSEQIVLIKGLFSGAGGIAVALIVGERFPAPVCIAAVMLLGFVAYGLSIKFYITTQNTLGAAKTSAFYAIAPFLGVAFSFIILGELPVPAFYLGLVVMIISTVIMIRDTLAPAER